MPDLGTDCGGTEVIRVGGELQSTGGTLINGRMLTRQEFDLMYPLTFNPNPRTHDDMADSLRLLLDQIDVRHNLPIDPDY
jgi:hypothetical protein